MKNNDKMFRKKMFGGFHSDDVVEYLSQLSQERQEEIEALRIGAEKLRRERDAALLSKISEPSENQDLAPELDALRAQVEGLVFEREENQRNLEKLRSQLDLLEKERGDLLEKLANVETAPSDNSELIELRTQLGNLLEELEAEQSSGRREMESLRKELAEARQQAAEIKASPSNIAEMDALRNQITELRIERDAIQTDRDFLLKTVAEQKNALPDTTQLEGQINVLRMERDELEGKYNALLEANRRQEADAAALSALRAEWDAERTALLSEKQKLQAEQGEYIGRIAHLREENAELLEKTEGLAHTMARAGVTRDRLEKEIQEAEAKIAEITSQSEATKQETAKLILQTRSRLNDVIASSKTMVEDVMPELDRFKELFVQFSQRFANLEENVSRLEDLEP